MCILSFYLNTISYQAYHKIIKTYELHEEINRNHSYTPAMEPSFNDAMISSTDLSVFLGMIESVALGSWLALLSDLRDLPDLMAFSSNKIIISINIMYIVLMSQIIFVAE